MNDQSVADLLPNETWTHILSYLNFYDLVGVVNTMERFNEIVKQGKLIEKSNFPITLEKNTIDGSWAKLFDKTYDFELNRGGKVRMIYDVSARSDSGLNVTIKK